MIMICNVPDEVIKSVKMGTWCGSSVAEKMISNGIPLDKLRAEIETKYGQYDICEYFEDYDYEENDISEYKPIGDIADILQIIDKYKAESEVDNGND
jgi:hypothetical protein